MILKNNSQPLINRALSGTQCPVPMFIGIELHTILNTGALLWTYQRFFRFLALLFQDRSIAGSREIMVESLEQIFLSTNNYLK